MSKYTPGPWSVNSSPHYRRGYIWGPKGPGYGIIAEASDQNTIANAHLIAAAPELLEALNKLVYFASYVAIRDNEADWGAVIAMAKAALIKAERPE